MKQISLIILGFSIGFYGGSLIIDSDPEVLVSKSIVFFTLVLISTVFRFLDDILNG